MHHRFNSQRGTIMETIFADYTVSISDFKARPAKAIEDAAGKPLAVLSHNKPVFYAISA